MFYYCYHHWLCIESLQLWMEFLSPKKMGVLCNFWIQNPVEIIPKSIPSKIKSDTIADDSPKINFLEQKKNFWLKVISVWLLWVGSEIIIRLFLSLIPMPILKLIGVHKTINNDKKTYSILRDIHVDIKEGSFTVIVGKSGSGKTTLLSLMSGLDTASSGGILFQNIALVSSNKKFLTQYRKKNGIVFQNFNLIPSFSVIENIIMGTLSKGEMVDTAYLDKLMTDLWLDKVKNDNVKTLSGGEKQRVAIARSLISRPKILFCDEPTGSLDDESGKVVMNILKKSHQQGQTIVLVTHNVEFKKLATQIITLQDGQILSHETN